MLHEWKEDSMLAKRIAACTHLFPTVYKLQRDIGRNSEIATFSYPLHLTPPLEFREKFGPRQKTRIIWLPGSEDWFDVRFSRFDTSQRVTDRQTSSLYQYRAQYD